MLNTVPIYLLTSKYGRETQAKDCELASL